MQSSKVGLQKWVIALYMMTTGLKGTSSMKLYREVGIRQATAWFLMQRIREGFDMGAGMLFPGPVEIDETYIGGKRKNMSKAKRKALTGRGAVGKTAVVGAKDRATNRVAARPVEGDGRADAPGLSASMRLQGPRSTRTRPGPAYQGMPFDHESVTHSAGEYVNGMAHVNGMESFWSMLKRGYHGTYHHMSAKHLDRYVREFAGRHNVRDLDTIVQMSTLARGMVGKRLKYTDLTA